MGWAIRQRTGDCASSYVLMLLAMRADERGEMTEIDADYLAERACVSRTTVFRCLKTLRDLGVFETETRFMRSGGRRVSGRLRLDVLIVSPDMREAHGSEDASERDAEEGSIKSERPDGQVVSNPNEGSSESERPTLCSNSLVIYPPNPPSAEQPETGEREGDDLEAQFEKFQRIYPFDASMRISEARKAFEALSLRDRARALRWGAAYAADLERRGATRPVDAARWLRERRFDDVEAVKGVQAKAQGLSGPRVFVAKGTRAWGAWVSHGHKPGLTCGSGTAGDSRVGWWFPSLWPPGVDPPAADGEAGCGVGG